MTPLPRFQRPPTIRQPIVTSELIDHHRGLAHDMRNAAIQRSIERGIHMLRLLFRMLRRL